MSKRSWKFVIGAVAVFAVSALYVAGQVWPWDTTGEGAKRENYH